MLLAKGGGGKDLVEPGGGLLDADPVALHAAEVDGPDDGQNLGLVVQDAAVAQVPTEGDGVAAGGAVEGEEDGTDPGRVEVGGNGGGGDLLLCGGGSELPGTVRHDATARQVVDVGPLDLRRRRRSTELAQLKELEVLGGPANEVLAGTEILDASKLLLREPRHDQLPFLLEGQLGFGGHILLDGAAVGGGGIFDHRGSNHHVVSMKN